MTPPYWAGFFDGEGNVDLRFRETHGGRYKRFEVRCTTAQVFRPVLERMQEQYGGSICMPTGNVSRLVLTGAQARRFLEDIRPFCIVKLDEVNIALDFFRVMEETPPHAAPGQHRFNKTPPEIESKKVILFHAMREARAAKGLRARGRPGVKQPYA